MSKRYEVRCEIMSRDPELACNAEAPTLRIAQYEHPQEGADACRAFVQDFSAADIPEKLRKWYSAADVPRAFMSRVNPKGANKPLFACYRDLKGEIHERRYTPEREPAS